MLRNQKERSQTKYMYEVSSLMHLRGAQPYDTPCDAVIFKKRINSGSGDEN